MSVIRRRPVEVICNECSNAFMIKPSLLAKRSLVYCSRKCYRDSHRSRFWSNVTKSDNCWSWNGCTNKFGYGVIGKDYRNIPAHRYSWELHNGPVPQGLIVCHKCDNPPCTNPSHLFLGTHRDNAIDRESKGRGARQDGIHNPASKITPEIVLFIFQSRADSNKSFPDIARDIEKTFGVCVSRSLVELVLKRKRWSCVDISATLLRQHK